MNIARKFFIVFTVPVLLAACSTPRHEILGTTYGWDASKVNVLSDVVINSLRVRHVRMTNENCKSGFKEHLELTGPIGPDSSEVVARILEKVARCQNVSGNGWIVPTVYLNSNGGLLKDGYQLGQTFRKFSAQTFITNKQVCASSCAIAFLGGKFRKIAGDGKLAFHSPYVRNGASISCPTKEEAKDLNDYYANFLEPKNSQFLFDRTMAFCSRSQAWEINADAAKLFGITTD
jgi:hypothetical protein